MCSVFLVALNSVSLDSLFPDFKSMKEIIFHASQKLSAHIGRLHSCVRPKILIPPTKAQQTSSSV